MRRINWWWMALAGVVAMAAPALAQMSEHGNMEPGGGHGMRMRHGDGMGYGMNLEALDLTADQKQKIEAVHERATRESIHARADLEVAQLDLQKLMRADAPDRRAVESQIDKIGGMRTRMQKARVGVMFDTRALLTDAQKKQLQEMRQEGPAKHKRAGPDGPKKSGT